MNTFRRPMFRGGKVDSRGTGITSGLSYNKGGRVGFFDGGRAPFGAPIPPGTGMNPTPTSTTFSTGPKFASRGGVNPFKISGYTPRQFAPGSFGQEFRAIPGLLGQGIRGIGFNPATAYTLGTFGAPLGLMYLNRPKTLEALKVMKNEPASTFDETAMIGIGDEPGEMDVYLQKLADANTQGEKISFLDALFMDPETRTYPSIFGRTADRDKRAAIEKAKIAKTTENPLDDGEGKALSPDQLKILELEKLIEGFTKAEPKAKDTDMEESIEIDKEKFAKALGRDKARGQDISDMLLSFSSKALAPDATVKSAFAEFAADEVKRPSRVRKIDDSAAALAINKYIKGEISRSEADQYIKRIELTQKLRDESNIKTAAEYIQAADEGGFVKKVKVGLNSYYAQQGIVPKYEVVKSKDMDNPEKFKFDPLTDTGVIFIEEDTREVYTFDSAGKKQPIINM
jgi:hypothetical protein